MSSSKNNRFRHDSVTYEARELEDGHAFWQIPNSDGRYNHIRTDGIASCLTEAHEQAKRQIANWHERRASAYR